MPCSFAVHITGRGEPDDGDWEPEEIVVVMPDVWKWSPKEKKLFLIVESNLDYEEMLNYQGRGRGRVKWEQMFDHEWERAAVRNQDIASPMPDRTRVVMSLIQKGPKFGVVEELNHDSVGKIE